jgi:hypothetical protein
MRKRVDSGKTLEDAHRVVRAQHGHAGTEAYTCGAGSDAGQHGLRSGDRELGPVMLAERDGVDAELVSKYGLVHDLPDGSGIGNRLAGVVPRQVAECVEAELKISHHVLQCSLCALLRRITTD